MSCRGVHYSSMLYYQKPSVRKKSTEKLYAITSNEKYWDGEFRNLSVYGDKIYSLGGKRGYLEPGRGGKQREHFIAPSFCDMPLFWDKEAEAQNALMHYNMMYEATSLNKEEYGDLFPKVELIKLVYEPIAVSIAPQIPSKKISEYNKLYKRYGITIANAFLQSKIEEQFDGEFRYVVKYKGNGRKYIKIAEVENVELSLGFAFVKTDDAFMHLQLILGESYVKHWELSK